MRRVAMILIMTLLVCPVGCLTTGCVSEGAGWRLNIQTAGFSIEYTNTKDSKGEHKFRQSFDQEGWSIIGPWLAPEDDVVGPPAPIE